MRMGVVRYSVLLKLFSASKTPATRLKLLQATPTRAGVFGNAKSGLCGLQVHVCVSMVSAKSTTAKCINSEERRQCATFPKLLAARERQSCTHETRPRLLPRFVNICKQTLQSASFAFAKVAGNARGKLKVKSELAAFPWLLAARERQNCTSETRPCLPRRFVPPCK